MTDVEDDDSKIFPQRLMEILSDEQNADSICWLPHGRAFVVRSRTLFAEKVMPRYFSRKAKYSSFTRKLNRWNFVRVSSGAESGAYYHEHFLRDKPHLVAQMFCKNARSKMAMAEPVHESIKEPSVVVASKVEPLAAVAPVAPPRVEQGQPRQQVYALDIPLGLLEALVKPTPAEALQERVAAPSTNLAQPGLLRQQSQYANLLLERQIQLLQQEQAKRMLHLLSQDSKPAAITDDRRLLQMQQIVHNNQHRQKGSPTNHRASAA